MNRGNAHTRIFHTPDDYREFLQLFAPACQRLPMRILAFCLMPNHFHLSLWPHNDGDLGTWMQWLMTSHVRRHHKRYQSDGHIWQGRFKAFPAQSDWHILSVMRYIERNPLRANLVATAQEWPWSSLRAWQVGNPGNLLDIAPIPRPENWLEWVNQPQSQEELDAIRTSIDRGSPLGQEQWTRQIAEELGLQSTLRSRGRPVKRGHSTFPLPE
jgi:putative transposase